MLKYIKLIKIISLTPNSNSEEKVQKGYIIASIIVVVSILATITLVTWQNRNPWALLALVALVIVFKDDISFEAMCPRPSCRHKFEAAQNSSRPFERHNARAMFIVIATCVAIVIAFLLLLQTSLLLFGFCVFVAIEKKSTILTTCPKCNYTFEAVRYKGKKNKQ